MRVRKVPLLLGATSAAVMILVSTLPASATNDSWQHNRLSGVGSASVQSTPSFGSSTGAANPASASSTVVFYNRGLPDMCLANHHPVVFMFGGCTGQYKDQYWYIYGRAQWRNLFSDQCLAAHGDGSVFTFDCAPGYADQMWRPYYANNELVENEYFPGQCLAAHSDGAVFLYRCTPEYRDQHWVSPY